MRPKTAKVAMPPSIPERPAIEALRRNRPLTARAMARPTSLRSRPQARISQTAPMTYRASRTSISARELRPETPEAAAVREVREEAGLETEPVELIERVEYWYYGSESGGRVRYHKFVHFFLLAYLTVMFRIVVDLFRDDSLGGFAKALWIIALFVLPLLTALIVGLTARSRLPLVARLD